MSWCEAKGIQITSCTAATLHSTWNECDLFYRQSYDVEISVDIPGSTSKSTNILDLKNPYFRYGGQVVAPPPQGSTTSPTEQYYQTNGYQTSTVNLKMGNQSQEQQVQNLANFTTVSISGGKLSWND